MTWEELVRKVAADPNAPRDYKSGRLSWEAGVLAVKVSYNSNDDYVLAMMIEGALYVSDFHDIQHVRQHRISRVLEEELEKNNQAFTVVRQGWLYDIHFRSAPRMRATITEKQNAIKIAEIRRLSRELGRELSIFSPLVEEELAKMREEALGNIKKLIADGAILSMVDADYISNYQNVSLVYEVPVTEIAGVLFNLTDDPGVKADCLKLRMGGDK